MGYYGNNGNVAGANNYNCNKNNVAGANTYNCNNNDNIVNFLRSLSPGTCVVLQYDHQKPAKGIFQGFQNGNVILSDYNGFPGLVRLNPCEINAVSPFSNCFNDHDDHHGHSGRY
ncbi:hypothetical protein [Ectobacillus ponti]|uniref:Uncharacterized protein n=1 Tax=Ectobacillus ponti TaxID=2961894 RepID=A0AA41XCH4_9BACI|nr:hypothetical protein [Ectobacillus ponti]MCP8970804.1 hypothetical protein [Ectobacillus ponti]